MRTPAAEASPNLMSSPPSPPAVPADQLRDYATAAERELRGNILPFWLAHARDRAHGGFVGRIGSDLALHPDAPRGTLLTSRILWTFSAAYRRYGAPEYLEMAGWARRELEDHAWDREQGGVYWTTRPDGAPLDTLKVIYGQAFAIYGLAEFYRATRDAEALQRAIALYRLIEAKAHDTTNGGYFEMFDRGWRRDESGQRVMGSKGPKSQNTHIHLLEAYTNLLRAWPDDGLRRNLRELIALMQTRIVDPRTHHLRLFFSEAWTPVSDEISYGHDIELSWLLVEAADVLGDPALIAWANGSALAMARATLREGVDRDGGVFNEGNPQGPTNTDKDWWPQAEAVVGFVNAYELSGDPVFLAASRRTWTFVQDRMVDRKNGDWYETVSRDGLPRARGNKLSQWKCPYHNSRACLELVTRLGKAPAQAVAP